MSEPKQRWRLVFRRDEAAMHLSHLDAIRAWERAMRRGEIPVAVTEGFSPRPRLVFAAPLPLGMLAEHELADLVLAERLTASDLRGRLAACLPSGYEVIDLFDVWVGEPALAPQLAAADYRLWLSGAGVAELQRAAERLLAAETLPRTRKREKRTIRYDLRPLILDLKVEAASGAGGVQVDGGAVGGGPAAALWLRLRHSQEGGTGRADEVVAALADELGIRSGWTVAQEGDEAASAPDEGTVVGGSQVERSELEVVRPVRERLWLASELA